MIPGAVIGGEEVSVPYFNWGWNYVVSSRSKKQELAYLFCLFASSEEVSTASIQAEGYFDPFLEAHYDDKKILKRYGENFLSIHKESLQNSIPDFYVQGQGAYFAALKQAVYMSCRGDLDPKSALLAVNKKWDRITESIGREKQKEQWLFLQKSYPEKIRRALK